MEKKTPIIALCGRARSGKSTAAEFLIEKHGYTRLKFAGPLKEMLACIGLSQDELEGYKKETPCDLLCGKSPRWAMQTLGSEWGRDLINENLWATIWKHKAQKMLDEGKKIVVDDCRFLNELEVVKDLGGISIRIIRTCIEPEKPKPFTKKWALNLVGKGEHDSEKFKLDTTYVLENNEGVDSFLTKIEGIITP
jgi:hypothetical protein